MKIYSVSTRHYYAFGALVSEELSHKLKGKVFGFLLLLFLESVANLFCFVTQICLEFDGFLLIHTMMTRIRIMGVWKLDLLILRWICILWITSSHLWKPLLKFWFHWFIMRQFCCFGFFFFVDCTYLTIIWINIAPHLLC